MRYQNRDKVNKICDQIEKVIDLKRKIESKELVIKLFESTGTSCPFIEVKNLNVEADATSDAFALAIEMVLNNLRDKLQKLHEELKNL